MNKRGDITLWHELIKAIPAVFLVLLLVWAGVQIYKATHPEQYSTEKKDLQRIVNEIKDLRIPQGDIKDEVTVPLFSRDYLVQALNTVEPDKKRAYPACNLDYCVCFVNKDVPVVCETFNLDKDYIIKEANCESGKKGVEIKSDKPSTNYPIIIKRTGICFVDISGTSPITPGGSTGVSGAGSSAVY